MMAAGKKKLIDCLKDNKLPPKRGLQTKKEMYKIHYHYFYYYYDWSSHLPVLLLGL